MHPVWERTGGGLQRKGRKGRRKKTCQRKGRKGRSPEKALCRKKEGNAPFLSVKVTMESVGIIEEEGNLNAPVPAPHTISSYSYSYPPFLAQVENPADDISTVIDNDVIEAKNDGATETVQWDEGAKYPYPAAVRIEECLTLKALH